MTSGREVAAVRMESFKRLWSACVSLCLSLCGDVNVCVRVLCLTAFKKRKKEKKKKGFRENTRPGGRLWPRGEDRAPGPFVVLVALGCVTSPAVSHRSVEGDTMPGSADEV